MGAHYTSLLKTSGRIIGFRLSERERKKKEKGIKGKCRISKYEVFGIASIKLENSNENETVGRFTFDVVLKKNYLQIIF